MKHPPSALAIASRLGAAMLLALMSVAAAAAAPAAPAGTAAMSDAEAEKLLLEVESRYARAPGLSASFTQAFRSAALGQEVVERGRLFVKRPGRMRWDYRQPSKKVFVVAPDGVTTTYVPADLSATRARIPADAAHLRLLMGDSRLLDSFAVSGVRLKEPRDASAAHLKLVPREPMGSLDVLYLEIDKPTRSVSRILVIDDMENESDLVLEKVRHDAVLRDEDFDLRLPPGIVVREAATPSGSP